MPGTSDSRHSMEDALWVRRALAGDHEAYGKLVEKHQRATVGFAYGVLGDMSAAEDAAQEGFIRAFQALDRLNKQERFLSWLRTIVKNAATDLLRHKQRVVSLDELAEVGLEPPGAVSEAPLDKLTEEERLAAMQKILDGLRPDYREIVVLRYGEEMSYREIAEVLDMKVSAVGEKLSRLRTLLRKAAGRAGVLSAKHGINGKEE